MGLFKKSAKKVEPEPGASADAHASGQHSRTAVDDDAEIGPTNAPKQLRRRHCTDVCCVIFFVAFVLGMFYLTYLACTVGDPYAILYGADYMGNRCGRGSYSNRPKTFYPRMDQDAMEQADLAATKPWKVVFYGLCVEECPRLTDPTVCFDEPSRCMVHDYGSAEQYEASGGSAYYFAVMPTISVMNRCLPMADASASTEPDRCVYPSCDNVTNPWMTCDDEFPNLWVLRTPSDAWRCEVKFQHVEIDQLAPMRPSPLTDRLARYMSVGQRVVEATLESTDAIGGFGLGLPIGLGFAWLLVLRFFAGVIVYAAIVAIGLALFGLALYLFVASGLLAELLASADGANVTRADAPCANFSVGDALGSVDLGSAEALGADAGSGWAGTSNCSEAAPSLASALLAGAEQVQATFVRLAPTDLSELSGDAASEDPLLYRLGAWVVLVVAVLYLVAMCLARKKIRIAVALIKESSKVLQDRPTSVFFPFCVLGAQVPLLIYLVVGLLFLGTADLNVGHLTSSDALTAHSTFADALARVNDTLSEGDDVAINNLSYIYFLFGILWCVASVKNIGWTTLSGSFSDWYFFRRDPKMASRTPLLASLGRVVRYHLGTIFFGSFIIALVQLARILLEFVDRQSKKLQETNKALKLAIKCLKCCLYCFEKTIKFITDYCYVYVALQGSSFCAACVKTFGLIMSQPAQLALNTFVRLVLALIQTVGITIFCAWLANAHLTSLGRPEPMYPAAVVALSAYVIASAFALVFSCALDTLFVCSVRDKAEYKGAFMSDGLYAAYGFDKADRRERRAAQKEEKAKLVSEGSAHIDRVKVAPPKL